MSTATQDSTATPLHPLVSVLSALLEEAGVEEPLLAAAAQTRNWRRHRRADDRSRLTIAEAKLIEEAVISLQGEHHDGETVSDEIAEQVVGRAEHQATVAEGLALALKDRRGRDRARESALQLLAAAGMAPDPEELDAQLGAYVQANKGISRVLKRKAKPHPAKLATNPDTATPTVGTDEQAMAQIQQDASGQTIVEADIDSIAQQIAKLSQQIEAAQKEGRTDAIDGLKKKRAALVEQGKKLAPDTFKNLEESFLPWREALHPRTRIGEFAAKIRALKVGETTHFPGGIRVQRKAPHEKGIHVWVHGNLHGQYSGKNDEDAAARYIAKLMGRRMALAEAVAEGNVIGKGRGLDMPDDGVRSLQQRLDELGFQTIHDGRFGIVTEEAVKAFQAKHGLKPTGKVDETTVAALREPPKPKPEPKAEEKPKPEPKAEEKPEKPAEQATTEERTEEGDMTDDLQEAPFNPSKHPRGRGGKWVEVLGKMVHVVKGKDFEYHDRSTPHRAYVAEHLPDIAASSSEISRHAGAPLNDRLDYQHHRSYALAYTDTPAFEEHAKKARAALAKVRKAAGLREAEEDARVIEASYSSGGFDTNTPARQSYGGVPVVAPGTSSQRMIGGQPEWVGVHLLADPDDRHPGMDDFFGNEPVRVPPNLHEAVDGTFERCGTCVHHNGKRLCAMYSAGTDRDDLCDSWLTLSPPQQQIAAMFYGRAVGQFVQEASATNAEKLRLARARLEEAVEESGGGELDAMVKKLTGKGIPLAAAKKMATKALARKRAQEAASGMPGIVLLSEAEAHAKLKCPKCDTVQSATNKKCTKCGHDLTDARKAKFANTQESALDEPDAHEALADWLLDEATLTAAKRKKLPKSAFAIPEKEAYPIHDEAHARNALARVSQHGTPEEKKRVRAAVKRKHPSVVNEAAWLVEVKSSVYPGLERVPGKQNWVDYAGGLPDYIERIAKHIHYEHGKPIGSAIAMAVGTVKRWCAGGEVAVSGKGGASKTHGVSAATKAKACAALASWEAKRKAGKSVKEAATEEDVGVLAVRAACAEALALDDPIDDMTQQDALRILHEVEVMEAAYPLSIHFDPRLHPRNRQGEFRDILGRLMKAASGAEVTMPNGVSVKRSRGGKALTVTRGGQKVGTFHKPEVAATKALAATGLPDTPTVPSYGKQTPRYGIAFERPQGSGSMKGADVISRAVAGAHEPLIGKTVSAVSHTPGTTTIYSYKEPLAHVDHGSREVHLNVHRYSTTSTQHRMMVEDAAHLKGYKIHKIDRNEALSRANMEPGSTFSKLPSGVKLDPGTGEGATGAWTKRPDNGSGIEFHSRTMPGGRAETLHKLPGWSHYRHMTFTGSGNISQVTDLNDRDATKLLGGETGGYVHLQSVGRHPAVKASEVKVGQQRVYNFGHTADITGVEQKGGMVHITTRHSDGSTNTRKHKPGTLIPVADRLGTKADTGTYGLEHRGGQTARFHAKHKAVADAESRAEATGKQHGVYLDSLGFLVAPHGSVTRTDVTEVHTTGGTSGVKADTGSGQRDLPSYLLGLGTGKHEITANGVPFTLYYDERGATGDDNRPVRGDKTGEWEVFQGHGDRLGRAIARVHVSPHGSSGYGNSAAPRYAAEEVARAIEKEMRKSSGSKFDPGYQEQAQGEMWDAIAGQKVTLDDTKRMAQRRADLTGITHYVYSNGTEHWVAGENARSMYRDRTPVSTHKPDGTKADTGVFDKNELKVARDTLKMHPAMAGVMGGPNAATAFESVKRLTGKAPTKSQMHPANHHLLDAEQMIARRVKGGHNEAQSRDLLAQLRREHSDTTLPAALAHHGFVGTSGAEHYRALGSDGTKADTGTDPREDAHGLLPGETWPQRRARYAAAHRAAGSPPARIQRPGSHNLPNRPDAAELLAQITAGTRVTIMTPHGQERTGRAVMRSSAGGWVLNMGGAHGTPGLVDERNIVKVSGKRKLREVAADIVAAKPALKNDPSMKALLTGDEAWPVRLPLAEALIRHKTKISGELREELLDHLLGCAPKEETETRLQEAREEKNPAKIRLYETLLSAVS